MGAFILGIVGLFGLFLFMLSVFAQLFVAGAAIAMGSMRLSRDSKKALAIIGLLLGIGDIFIFIFSTGFLGLYPVLSLLKVFYF